MFKKYRTKPCEIMAMQWTGDNFEDIRWFTKGNAYMERMYGTMKEELVIVTLEGHMIASIGDFIIEGLRGEFYPCKPDVFHKKYEEIQ